MLRNVLAAVLVLALAACSQSPAPVIYGQGTLGNPDMPPLPPELPVQRLAQFAEEAPPLPGEKPQPPSPMVTSPPASAAPASVPPTDPSLPLADVAVSLLQPASPEAPAVVPEQASVGYVTVLPGDTVYAISRRYDVAVKDVIDVNELREPYTLFVGQDLRLPSQRYHTVAPGESLSAISARYRRPANDIIAANDLKPPYTLFVGQRLAIPGIAADGTVAEQPVEENEAVAAVAVPEQVALPARGRLQFIWPVEGTVLSTFGAKEDGLHNDGINIAAPAGAPVYASEDGVVAYVGDELRGYGNLILIKHAEGWVSAYAHNSQVRVARGQQVQRGQVIGTVGVTGGVTSPQSHFELRRDGQAVDPLDFLVRL
jgi:murein DD-endopeptidase MepM/ murein hydrolase activator NlpD